MKNMNKTSRDRSRPVHFSILGPVHFSKFGPVQVSNIRPVHSLLVKPVYKAFSLILVILILFGLFSCDDNGKREIKPETVIDRETMIMLLADMDVTDAALKTRQIGLSHDSIRKISAMAYDSLYLYYKITPRIFRENMRYYQRDMEDYQNMLDEKITLLTRRKDSLTIEPEKLDTSRIKPINIKGTTVRKDSSLTKGKSRK